MAALQGKRVLVLGGSLFMGPPTIEHLLSAGCAVTVMNRGVSTPVTDFGSRVTIVRCDRKSAEFATFLRHSGRWDAIVDYIAYLLLTSLFISLVCFPLDRGTNDLLVAHRYTVAEVEPLLSELGPEKIGHYVYISSHSPSRSAD